MFLAISPPDAGIPLNKMEYIRIFIIVARNINMQRYSDLHHHGEKTTHPALGHARNPAKTGHSLVGFEEF